MKLLEIKKLGSNLEDVRKELQIRQSSNIKQTKKELLETINDNGNFVQYLQNLEKCANLNLIEKKNYSNSMPRANNKK
jgi:acetyl-CoA carboxylase beta subunit